MKKIILFVIVFIPLTLTIIFISCKKEKNTIEKNKTSINHVNNNLKGLIINESNYKDYLDDPDVVFFFRILVLQV